MTHREDIESDIERLLRRRQRELWRLCLRQSWGDGEQARDLMQEVVLALLRAAGQRRADASEAEERTWVLLVARRTLFNLRRKRRVETVALDETMPLAEENGNPAREIVEEMRQRLAEGDQRLLALYMDGYAVKEIAQELSISADAASVRLHRLIQRLRTLYNETYNTL